MLKKEELTNRIQEAYETAKNKGWHDEPREFGTLVALMHSEVTEAFEALMPDGEDNFSEELADVLIRIYDCCGLFNIPLANVPFRPMREGLDNGTLQMMYIHRALSRALECYRKSEKDRLWEDVAQWFAEVHVLIYEIGLAIEVDLNAEVRAKMDKNKSRPHRHGGKRV